MGIPGRKFLKISGYLARLCSFLQIQKMLFHLALEICGNENQNYWSSGKHPRFVKFGIFGSIESALRILFKSKSLYRYTAAASERNLSHLFTNLSAKQNTHRIINKSITLFVDEHKVSPTDIRKDLFDTC